MNESDPLDALLQAPLIELPDAGFSDAVMRRVRALPPAPTAAQTLGRMKQLRDRSQRTQRYGNYGLAVGAAIALAWAAGIGGMSAAELAGRGVTLGLALAVSGAALAWALLSEPA